MPAEDEVINTNAAPSYLDMSDDDIAKVDIGAVSLQASEAPVDTAGQGTDEVVVPPVEVPVVPDEEDDDDVPVVPVVPAANEEVVPPADKTADGKPPVEPPADDKTKPADKTDKTDKTEPEAIDYKAAYERLVAPFKANGRDIAVNSVDDAISLMQMGANYTKKMAALKPNLKIMKMLESNGLLDEGQLSYLIDLHKKDPAAINKLVMDSKMDPLDMSADKAGDYKPKNYKVDDLEIELDTVLDELQDTPSYNKTLDIVSNKWDGPSKKAIANSPQILRVINDHVERGIYDLIHTEMESERVYGRLKGLSDIEAYKQVGDAIQARGGFDHLGHQGHQTPPPVVVVPKPKPADDDKLKDKKRAASTSKPAGPATGKADYNPLALSDEDFEKQASGKYS